ncbi:MAG: hypothetical protein HN730_12795 [Bdellovibrionales bacterium]|nr:hypothetical protein [Bdellovibrionales bacterium]
MTTSISAKERYVYEARALVVAKATLVIDVEDVDLDGQKYKAITSNISVRLLGKKLIDLDFQSLNVADSFAPVKNIECYLEKKRLSNPADKNCRSVHFLENGEYLYLNHRQTSTNLIGLRRDMPNVEEYNVLDIHQDFDKQNDRVFDLASIALLVKYLHLSAENPNKDLFVAVNKSVVKVRISYVKDIGRNKIWIKITPLHPAPEFYKRPFPHKIVYDHKRKAVTQIHQKLPIVGNAVIKLSKKRSSF